MQNNTPSKTYQRRFSDGPLHFLVGGDYALNDRSGPRGTFTFQSADADLVGLATLDRQACTDNIPITKPSVSTWAIDDT